ncbi:hypothetical protein Pint_06382 [Pistacia integerrima]|uniref:Uncharacterized protein n=1 Tax=Pistacia integerrima TaxID=434235 RepID=A0ACC0Z7T7_9ROSI|nr:hypothetical protein Pint_06382 [Pistacia integerrima]
MVRHGYTSTPSTNCPSCASRWPGGPANYAAISSRGSAMPARNDSKPSVCLVCRYPCLAWRYTCKKCDVHIHMECVNYSANFCDLKKQPVGPSWASPSPYVYYPSGMMPSFHNQQAESSGSNGGYFGKKIYSVVAGLAANVIVASVTGIPAFPFL